MPLTRKLTPSEQRVVGALMEKEQTTPAAYPLTVNALLAACNQKSGRDPVTSLSEEEVWDTLEALRQDVLVWRREGSRAERWEHCLERRWHLTPAAKAVITLLLLRGPQTPGELRTRSSRMHDFASMEEIEAVLHKYSQGDDALVRERSRRPGQRDSRWTHVMGTRQEAPVEVAVRPLVDARPPVDSRPPALAPGPRPAPATESLLERRIEALEQGLRELRERMAELAGGASEP